jgi:hypothetical protein
MKCGAIDDHHASALRIGDSYGFDFGMRQTNCDERAAGFFDVCLLSKIRATNWLYRVGQVDK